MGVDLSQFYQSFFEESLEGLDVMENGLLQLTEGAPDTELINTIFRPAHSIKGGSGTFGFNEIGEFTHVLESLLDEMREGTRHVTRGVIDLLLQSVDCLREMIYARQNGTDVDPAKIDEIQASLIEIWQRGNSGASPAATDTSAQAQGAGELRIVFHPHPHLLRTGNDPVLILRELADLGEVEVTADLSRLPLLGELDPEESYLGWEIRLRGEVDEAAVREVFEWVSDDCDLTVEALAAAESGEESPLIEALPPAVDAVAEASPAGAPASGGGERRASKESASIRVQIDKVDALVNMVGELVITQAMLSQLGEDFEMGRLENLRSGLAQLTRNTRDLQEAVMRIRMLPISVVFSRVPRLVHDLSAKLGKKVNLVMTGEGTELDKTVLEKIGDPLVHLVRNCLDHGVEPPAERRKIGKPETGTMTMHAYHQGGNILIEIRDDGAGLNKERILSKAREQGLLGPNDSPTDEDINDLIFNPGFSTAAEISDVSGRGVGMDVVRRNIADLDGTVEVKSTPGRGTCFTIRLPLTLAILDGQLIRVSHETFIIPLVSIVESLQIKSKHLHSIAGTAEVYSLRDDYIPIVRLAELFGLTHERSQLEGSLLVVVEGDGKKCGLLVDDLLAQQQVVIKSLEANYRRVEGVSGATILGDGHVALILDISGLIRLSQQAIAGPCLV
ncbi:MAG: chemotaxis protein CheA [Planctomycetota bacterium]